MFVTTYTMKLLFNLFVLLTGSNTKLAISGKWLHWLLLLRTKLHSSTVTISGGTVACTRHSSTSYATHNSGGTACTSHKSSCVLLV